MASQEQIAANQKNAQLSRGPVSETGKQISSKNSATHGFTGKTLILCDEEKEAYDAHVASYYADYKPIGHKQTQLLQQLADLHWAFHQISVDQANAMSLMNTIHAQARQQQADPETTFDKLAKGIRHITNLSLYEGRKRRAAKAIQEEFLALQKADYDKLGEDLKKAAALYKTYKAQGKSFDPAEFGFVCSIEDLDNYFRGQQAAADVASHQSASPQPVVDPRIQKMLDENQAQCRQMDEEIAAIMEPFNRETGR
jgi:hypothetical protein